MKHAITVHELAAGELEGPGEGWNVSTITCNDTQLVCLWTTRSDFEDKLDHATRIAGEHERLTANHAEASAQLERLATEVQTQREVIAELEDELTELRTVAAARSRAQDDG